MAAAVFLRTSSPRPKSKFVNPVRSRRFETRASKLVTDPKLPARTVFPGNGPVFDLAQCTYIPVYAELAPSAGKRAPTNNKEAAKIVVGHSHSGPRIRLRVFKAPAALLASPSTLDVGQASHDQEPLSYRSEGKGWEGALPTVQVERERELNLHWSYVSLSTRMVPSTIRFVRGPYPINRPSKDLSTALNSPMVEHAQKYSFSRSHSRPGCGAWPRRRHASKSGKPMAAC